MSTSTNTAAAPVAGRQVVAAYDHLAPLIARYWGPDLHHGYWTGPEDDSPIEVATARLTTLVVGRLGVGPGDRVLDLGCGHGAATVEAAKATGAEVVGVDVNPRALADARRRADMAGLADLVTFVECDALDTPFPDGAFDAVLAFESTPHFALSEVFPEIARLLRPRGRLVVETPFLRTPVDDDLLRRVAEFFDLLPMTALGTLGAHFRLLREAGLDVVEFVDVTEHVGCSFTRLVARLRDHRADLEREYGVDETARVLRAFADWAAAPELAHMILVARRADRA
ncbi:Methyltransferase domain-containing protein [Streptoalloteichus tenebrarius]|uniref:Methyltransferase domain-containing protein n=1 Tax=Streptoalloteichus tenebrarius (strain ATCC 17920 / DSM 40477 / JCM 4838 / CBS 697.72 / NBRC 16177 / NCIMB 11028 / NRRL B-12390 / A12253. 1 / ISP 5477) TaxID=1933 RepID=A0ABT1I153_STRSD|nr:methyltransferase domain-containing protein [Streptoalloteichus tenebrarius]MCP2261517.1 Methyltransferase domain-containing protein [Streptoalloteichus tenebrarius]BFE99323.1 27-O-demethylrifamycin SV methyltransferase [Streptoalloteichus tenebrarius]